MKNNLSRHLFPRLECKRFLEDTAYQEDILALVNRGVGGFVLFEGTLEEASDTIERLRSHSSDYLLLAADCEFGLPMRFPGGTEFTSMMGLGYADDPEMTEEVASAIAKEMEAIGLDWNFAPVLDVNSNPDNPIINVRSFGEDQDRVAEHGAAYIRGMQKNGIIGCGKHFPGHGDTSVDSHIGLPVLEAKRERLDELELLPFRRAVKEGVLSVMSGHLSVPALDPSGLPASLSPPILKRLREELEFEGVVVTDALDMGAIITRFGAEEGVVQAFLAGNDVLEIPKHPAQALKALSKACDDGRITQQMIDASSLRLQALVRWRKVHRRNFNLEVVLSDGASLAEQVASASLKVVDSTEGRGLFSNDVLVIILVDENSENSRENVARWIELLERQGYSDILPNVADEPDTIEDALQGSEATTVLLITSVRPRGGAGSVELSPRQQKIVRSINHSRSILLNLGNPYLLAQYLFGLRIDTFSSSLKSIAAGLSSLNVVRERVM